MPYILLASFTDEDGTLSWRAFSSTDETRALFRLRNDTFYEIGYQESHPEDKTTSYGLLTLFYQKTCDIALEHRMSGIQLVLTPDNTLNTEFGFLTATESYNQVIPEGHVVAVVPHTFIDPNPFYTTMDADSDSDSDSD